MSSSSLADRERAELADLLEKLGPDAPTCCAGWTCTSTSGTSTWRDRRVDAMPGYGLEQVSPALGAWAHRVEDRLRESTDYADVVARVRSYMTAGKLPNAATAAVNVNRAVALTGPDTASQITINYPFQFMVLQPVASLVVRGSLLGGPITMAASAQMRNETQ